MSRIRRRHEASRGRTRFRRRSRKWLAPPRQSDAEWRAALTEEEYRVTRLKGTERAFSSELCGLFEPGRYYCICCDFTGELGHSRAAALAPLT